MKLSLFEISNDISEILGSEEWGDETLGKLETLNMALEKKAENVIHYSRNLDGFIDAAGDEIKRLQARKKAAENRKAQMMDYVKGCLEAVDRTDLEAGTFKLKIQQNNHKCVIEDELAIPAKYFVVVPQTTSIDRKALLDDMKAGEEVPGASMVRGTSLRVR